MLPEWAKGLQNKRTFRVFNFRQFFMDTGHSIQSFADEIGMTNVGVSKAILRGTMHYAKTVDKLKDKYPDIEKYFD